LSRKNCLSGKTLTLSEQLDTLYDIPVIIFIKFIGHRYPSFSQAGFTNKRPPAFVLCPLGPVPSLFGVFNPFFRQVNINWF
jgi:hypothetical protein